jgi:hypothetical protein
MKGGKSPLHRRCARWHPVTPSVEGVTPAADAVSSGRHHQRRAFRRKIGHHRAGVKAACRGSWRAGKLETVSPGSLARAADRTVGRHHQRRAADRVDIGANVDLRQLRRRRSSWTSFAPMIPSTVAWQQPAFPVIAHPVWRQHPRRAVRYGVSSPSAQRPDRRERALPSSGRRTEGRCSAASRSTADDMRGRACASMNDACRHHATSGRASTGIGPTRNRADRCGTR